MPIPGYENFAEFALGFEGVLVDPKPARIGARHAAFLTLGQDNNDRAFKHASKELFEESYSHHNRSIEAVSWMLEKLGIPDGDGLPVAHDLADKEYDEYRSRLTPIAGSIPFVKSLAQTVPERLSIVARGIARTEVEPFLAQNRISGDNYFPHDRIWGREDVMKPKPNPEIYERLIKHLGVNPEELLVIEGNPEGVESARQAGATVVAIANTYTSGEFRRARREVRPNAITSSFEGLCKAMKLPRKLA